MKELHNHIFSNTTCISKETMLSFINKQLSKKDLYEVEKHMLDCELCSDAYAGMQYAENASMLFVIDNQIDKRLGKGVAKAPLMRNLMLAASIMLIAFGTYFTVTFFNKTINNNTNLAVNDVEITTRPLVKEVLKNEELSDTSPLKKEELVVKPIKPPTEINKIRPAIIEEKKEKVLDYDLVIEEVTSESELVVYDFEEENEEAVVSSNSLTISPSSAPSFNYTLNKSDNLYEGTKGFTTIDSKNSKRMLEGGFSNSTNQYSTRIEEEIAKDAKTLNTLTIEEYKVVNYLEEYQKEYDKKQGMPLDLSGVSVAYENKQEKVSADDKLRAKTVEITYKETLEKAMRFYRKEKFVNALAQFDIILAKHPNEVNGLFYKGMSFYKLGEYNLAKQQFALVLTNSESEFNPEANWHKALSLIELNEVDLAKQLLNEIVNKNGYYKRKAEKKLKLL